VENVDEQMKFKVFNSITLVFHIKVVMLINLNALIPLDPFTLEQKH